VLRGIEGYGTSSRIHTSRIRSTSGAWTQDNWCHPADESLMAC